MLVPKNLFFTKGVGRHKAKLAIVRVSSILPPKAKILSKNKGICSLSAGEITYTVMAECSTNEPHRLIAASIGVAIPKDRTQYGYLSEYHSYGDSEIKVADEAEDLAAQMLATTLGVPFNPDTSYDERKEIWRISREIVKTTAITQTAIGNKNGLWTTVIAAAVFVP
jgi:arginine decarboxylase